jgi:hypothetical protein
MSDVKIKENSDVAMFIPFSFAIIHYPTVSGFNMEVKLQIYSFICYFDQPLNSDTVKTVYPAFTEQIGFG